MLVGTNHFVSKYHATKYYTEQGIDVEGVEQKIREGEIKLGMPAIKPGEKIVLIDRNTRYAIEDWKDSDGK